MYFGIPVLLHFVRHFIWLESDLKEQLWGHSTQSLSGAQLSCWLQNKVTFRVPRQVSSSNVIACSHQKDSPSVAPWHRQHLPSPSAIPATLLWLCRIPLATPGTGTGRGRSRSGASPTPQQLGRLPAERPAPGTARCSASLRSRHSEPALGNSPWPVLFPRVHTAPAKQFPSLNPYKCNRKTIARES